MNLSQQQLLIALFVVFAWVGAAVVTQRVLTRITKWSGFRIYAASLAATSLLAALAEWYFIDIYAAIGLLIPQVVIVVYNYHKLRREK